MMLMTHNTIDVCGHSGLPLDLRTRATLRGLGGRQRERSSDEPGALARLMAGNQRFQNDTTGHPLLRAKRRAEHVGGQAPFAVILSCSDWRVPPELIFDQGLGGLFMVRLAGNTVTRVGLESIDYAIDHLGTKLIMVLGHDSCGAVKGALAECVSKPAAGLPEIFANICPAVGQARKAGGDNLESSTIDLNLTNQVGILELR